MDFLSVFGIGKKGITVYAFYGPSGTGKSYRAKIVAQKNGIKVLIDDGLLIQDDKILAGKSAKMEQNYMGAVRTALFDSKDHRDEVAKAIVKNHIKKILILGTSEKMVNKIALRLQLPLPEKYIKIQDIATPEQMEEARRSRMIEGKHVIPVRAYEIKGKNYSKIFVKSIRVALGKKKFFARFFSKSQEVVADTKQFEKSLVRPTFSIPKRKDISHACLVRMTVQYFAEFNKEIRIKKLVVKNSNSGYIISLTTDVPSGNPLAEFTQNLKDYTIQNIEKESGVLVEEMFITIDKIIHQKTIA